MTTVVKTTKMPADDPRRSLDGAVLYWLHQSNQAVRGEVLRRIRDRGRELGTAQWEVLTQLWQRDGASQSILARATGRDRAGMTRLLDRMEREGLVQRRADRADRRVHRVHLTAAGRRLHGQLIPVVSEVIASALDGLSEKDKTALRNGLKRIHGNLAG
jgi:DNA-binding MarR family transcriptional regulator